MYRHCSSTVYLNIIVYYPVAISVYYNLYINSIHVPVYICRARPALNLLVYFDGITCYNQCLQTNSTTWMCIPSSTVIKPNIICINDIYLSRMITRRMATRVISLIYIDKAQDRTGRDRTIRDTRQSFK